MAEASGKWGVPLGADGRCKGDKEVRVVVVAADGRESFAGLASAVGVSGRALLRRSGAREEKWEGQCGAQPRKETNGVDCFEMIYLHLQHGFSPAETGGREGRLQAARWRGEVSSGGEMEGRGWPSYRSKEGRGARP